MKQNQIIPKYADIDTATWLSTCEANLRKEGYVKYKSKVSIAKEDFYYAFTFENYQILVLFYDFRKSGHDRIGIMFKCILKCDSRIDLEVSKSIDLPEFEKMASDFYKTMKKYF